jgi:hypothetical protein
MRSKTGTERHYHKVGGSCRAQDRNGRSLFAASGLEKAVHSLTIPAGPRVQVPLIGSDTH